MIPWLPPIPYSAPFEDQPNKPVWSKTKHEWKIVRESVETIKIWMSYSPVISVIYERMRLVKSKYQQPGERCSASVLCTQNISPLDPHCADISSWGHCPCMFTFFLSLELPKTWKNSSARQLPLYLVHLLLCSPFPVCPEGEWNWIQIFTFHVCLSRMSC